MFLFLKGEERDGGEMLTSFHVSTAFVFVFVLFAQTKPKVSFVSFFSQGLCES